MPSAVIQAAIRAKHFGSHFTKTETGQSEVSTKTVKKKGEVEIEL